MGGDVSGALVKHQRNLALDEPHGHIRAFAPSVVPAPLQTATYARTVLTASGLLRPEHVEEVVAIRMRRQRLLIDAEHPRTYVVTETALRRPIGGVETMTEQHLLLLALAELAHVTLRVLPEKQDPPVIWSCGFTLTENATTVEAIPFPLALPITDTRHYLAHFHDLFHAAHPYQL
ncbi:DUF5753 domain-containing protein [Nocardiopsis ansamitocini]|uniref:DUF5753 domain-containing protein n=1 Tax=Nocardiopsis ansamitocini TaxID=1670832 RepID=A0A9W6P9Z0_9ACTN|nr:DUF5753 domain-containing protein [Nocardiopsis ansamitocini]GLU49687.1 hypothetical protein Nans01_40380 [Nocardiopsis ansamitocini]